MEDRRSRSRSRSRSRDDDDDDRRRSGRTRDDGDSGDPSKRISNVYVRNLSFETTDESLRAAFQQFGEISSASVVKEPITHVSRGFGFVSFANPDDAEKAVSEMANGEVDGRPVRVEIARRSGAYDKTPGRYLGPPQMSTKLRRERSPPRYDYGGGYDYSRGPPRDSYREERYRVPLDRYDPRDPRSPLPPRDYYPPAGDRYGRYPEPSYRGYRDYDLPPPPREYDDRAYSRERLPPPREYDDRDYRDSRRY